MSKLRLFFCANAAFENGASTQMPSTVALISLKFESASRNVHSSFSQTPVKDAGKKAKTTFLPLRPERETSCLLWLKSLKSGAGDPTLTMAEA